MIDHKAIENDAIDYCAAEFDSEVFVPNSKDEAEFIGNYLSGRSVSIFSNRRDYFNGLKSRFLVHSEFYCSLVKFQSLRLFQYQLQCTYYRVRMQQFISNTFFSIFY